MGITSCQHYAICEEFMYAIDSYHNHRELEWNDVKNKTQSNDRLIGDFIQNLLYWIVIFLYDYD